MSALPGGSSGSGGSSGGSSGSQPSTGAAMTEQAQKQRRNSIRDILADEHLTPFEKRRSIQSLMDGRRRSSNATHSSDDSGPGGTMARAAEEAAEFYSSDTDDDMQIVHPHAGAATTFGSAGSSADGGSTTDYAAAYSNEQAMYYGYGQQASQNDPNRSETGENPQRSKPRSASLPGWSDVGLAAPIAATAGASNQNSIWDDPININRRMEKSRPACNHYERNCTIISPCCGLAFGCRICHDECPVLPMPFSKRQQQQMMMQQQQPQNQIHEVDGGDANVAAAPSSGLSRIHNVVDGGMKQRMEKRRSLPLGFEEEETHHEIDRFAIAEIICRLCYARQPSKT